MLVLAACTPAGERLPAQMAPGNYRVAVEMRPGPMQMIEFLVIVDRPHQGFINDLIVSVRTEDSDWQQAIPDGALGVYRRALRVRDRMRAHLFVRLRRFGEKKPFAELVFPLAGASS